MNAYDQERMEKMFQIVDEQKKYKEMYGEDWKKVYKEDKENSSLIEKDY